MNSLPNLRKMIDATNSQIFDLYNKRLDLITEVAQLKLDSESSVWDPQREIELFKHYCKDYNKEYDLIFSQLIEVQAVEFMNYPKWSSGVHLVEHLGNIEDFINPVLLFVRNSSKYQSLKLKKEYQDKIEGILND